MRFYGREIENKRLLLSTIFLVKRKNHKIGTRRLSTRKGKMEKMEILVKNHKQLFHSPRVKSR
jgi:hypothetical protein